jgi:hypothetical protein
VSHDRKVIPKSLDESLLTNDNSEMIAELPVPQSNLDSWERFMPWPNVHVEDFMNSVNTVQRDGYRTQLLIRKHLNTIYAKLYGQGHQDSKSHACSHRHVIVDKY